MVRVYIDDFSFYVGLLVQVCEVMVEELVVWC